MASKQWLVKKFRSDTELEDWLNQNKVYWIISAHVSDEYGWSIIVMREGKQGENDGK